MTPRTATSSERHRRAPATPATKGRTFLAVAVTALGISLPLIGATSASASAAAARPHVSHAKPPIVVKAETRKGFGVILVTPAGGALYRDTNDGPNMPTCTGSCAKVWPPLVLPAGDTKPRGGKGVTGLGTVKIANNQLQVTYNTEPLYTFSGDSGKSVNGNGVGPFLVVPA